MVLRGIIGVAMPPSVSIASVSGVRPSPGTAAYGAAKAALISLTKTLAVEWAWTGARVNALLPGWIETDLTEFLRDESGAEAGKALIKKQPELLKNTMAVSSALSLLSRQQVIERFDIPGKVDGTGPWAVDAKAPDAETLCNMVKLYASESVLEVCKHAVELHGGNGTMLDFGIEKLYRDAKIGRIYEGTANMQRVTIAKHLLG